MVKLIFSNVFIKLIKNFKLNLEILVNTIISNPSMGIINFLSANNKIFNPSFLPLLFGSNLLLLKYYFL